MWWMALASACEIETVVAGFPIGPVPTDARFQTVLRSDCAPEQVSGQVRLSANGLPLDDLPVTVEAEAEFLFLAGSGQCPPGSRPCTRSRYRSTTRP